MNVVDIYIYIYVWYKWIHYESLQAELPYMYDLLKSGKSVCNIQDY